MKFLLLTILIFFFSGCARGKVSGTLGRGKSGISAAIEIPVELPKKDIFYTPFGEVKKGLTMDQVRYMLGNPHRTSSQENSTIWYYHFPDHKRFAVYFINGSITEIRYK